MQLKTVTWNIGGGKHLKEGDDPLLMASYSVDAISEIADWLKAVDPDIITLQEAQGNSQSNQVKEIAELLGFGYYFFDTTSQSHIDNNMLLGNGLISKHPISNHDAGVFLNPNIEAELQGRHIQSHDKGYGVCSVNFHDDRPVIQVMTLHLLPFRAFGIDIESETGKGILSSVSRSFPATAQRLLIQGDFNIDSQSVKDKLPELSISELEEVLLEMPTTPSGKRYDHVLFKGLKLLEKNVDSSVKTDHYPVSCIFQIFE